MQVALVLPTYNRLFYTQKTIERLLEDKSEQFDLYLWDNASTDETPDFLKSLKDPRIKDIYLSKENLGQSGAMNWAWSKTKAELVGKLDNDCLPTPGWTRIFTQAHQDIPQLGAVCMWHFFEEDFDFQRAKHKIQEFNGHRIFRHPWVAGSGFLMKRKTFEQLGRWKIGDKVGTTYYFMNMAKAGWINGWYYPLVLQEHMDDPKSKFCMLKDKNLFDIYKHMTYGYKTGQYSDLSERLKCNQEILRNILDDPYDPYYYSFWARKLRRALNFFRKS